MIIQICIGSSCHLKGAEEMVEKFETRLKDGGYEADVTLAGSFCTGHCNRKGVTIQIDDDVFPGVTLEEFPTFFDTHVKQVLKEERNADRG